MCHISRGCSIDHWTHWAVRAVEPWIGCCYFLVCLALRVSEDEFRDSEPWVVHRSRFKVSAAGEDILVKYAPSRRVNRVVPRTCCNHFAFTRAPLCFSLTCPNGQGKPYQEVWRGRADAQSEYLIRDCELIERMRHLVRAWSLTEVIPGCRKENQVKALPACKPKSSSCEA